MSTASLADRQCEGPGCGNRIPPGIPRRRNDDGLLLCPACSAGRPSGVFAMQRQSGIMDYYDVVVHRRGDEGAAREHGTADLQEAVAHATQKHADPNVLSVHVINRGNDQIFWSNGKPNPDAYFYSPPPRYSVRNLPSHTQRIAHDSGDGFAIFHCPFCGGGQVVARGDGSTECAYCGQVFTVQVQPFFPGLPQSDPNVPSFGGVQNAPPPDGSASTAEQGSTDKAGSLMFIASGDVALDRDAFMFRLALENADDHGVVVRAAQAHRFQRGERVTVEGHPILSDGSVYEVWTHGRDGSVDLKGPDGRHYTGAEPEQLRRVDAALGHDNVENTRRGGRPWVVHHANGQDYWFHYSADADLLAGGRIDHDEAVKRGAKITPRTAADQQWNLFGDEWQGRPRYKVHFSASRPEWDEGVKRVLDEYGKRGRKILAGPNAGTCTDSGLVPHPCNEVIVEGRDDANLLHGLGSAIIPGAVHYENHDTNHRPY